jgi:hypothetical protein
MSVQPLKENVFHFSCWEESLEREFNRQHKNDHEDERQEGFE